MKSVLMRLERLEERLAPAPDNHQMLFVLGQAGRKLALDDNACIGILRESGFLKPAPIRLVRLGDVPDGLDAVQLERFLRESGARIT